MKQKLLQAMFAVLLGVNAQSQTLVFSDNFSTNVIDANKWMTTGYTVSQVNGNMRVGTDITDRGGILTSFPIAINSTGDITISRQVFVHRGNSCFAGCVEIRFGNLPWCGVYYADYGCDSYYLTRRGTYIGKNFIAPAAGNCYEHLITVSNQADISASFPMLWDTWFNEKIVYSPTSGILQYFVNNQKVTDFNVGIMPAVVYPTIQLGFRAWGWFTGHEEDFKNLTVTQNGTFITPPPITQILTNRSPSNIEVGQPTIPNDPNHFKVFTNGAFQSGIALNPNKTTVILTHGWNGSPSDWAAYTAQIIQQRIGANAVNIVAWDWHTEASVPLPVATQFTLGEGYKLGTDLSVALGTGYTQKIHFIGHSLGTLVNASAANYLHSHGFSPANTQMTLCDEAEIAWGTTSQDEALATLFTLLNNSSTSQPFWGNPLPRQFNWADNYISACGMLHPEAANVILTWEFPTSFPNFDTLKTEFFNFHDFAHYFYEDTIEPSIFNTGGQTNASYAGFVCSFEGGGVANRPASNTYFYQDPNGYELTLVQTNYSFATNFLNQRLWSYIGTIKSSGVDWVVDKAGNAVLQAYGQVQGAIDYTGNLIINLFTSSGNSSPAPNGLVRPMGGPVPLDGASANNSPAYAWIPFFVPLNAISMSFDFILQGDGANDSFQAALNGTNILSLETILIQTNVTVNSGMIDVSAYAGQTNEFFVGIVGGTSTNAQLTVQNLLFYSAPAPSLQAQSAGNNPVLTWPISATGFNLQCTTNLADPNSWTTLTNVPAIANLQNAVTNPVSGGAVYYRLKK